MTLRTTLAMLAGISCVVATFFPKNPILIWNASPSVPMGLYRMANAPPRFGDLVVVQLRSSWSSFADRRGYLPRSAYLLKPVSAVVKDRVCRFGTLIFVQDRFAALAITRDRFARLLPVWRGCRILRRGELFLLADNPDSFDSRYFGPIDVGQVAGVATPVWPLRRD